MQISEPMITNNPHVRTNGSRLECIRKNPFNNEIAPKSRIIAQAIQNTTGLRGFHAGLAGPGDDKSVVMSLFISHWILSAMS